MRIGKCNSCGKEINSKMFEDVCTRCKKKMHRPFPNLYLVGRDSMKHVNEIYLDCQICDELGEPLCIPCYNKTKNKSPGELNNVDT